MCTTCGCHTHSQQQETVELERAILETNNHYATQNKNYLEQKNNIALNFVSSPGAGKTTLLEKTIAQLSSHHPIVVIEGDQQTSLDADRIVRAGAEAYQINTGKSCHLDAHRVGHAFEHLTIKDNGFVFIENVGNLICPALFNLGEHHRVVILSTTEGEDKPLKYPDMFWYADTVIINKIDLLPYVKFDIEACVSHINKIRSDIRIFKLSADSGEGLSLWLQWLSSLLKSKAA